MTNSSDSAYFVMLFIIFSIFVVYLAHKYNNRKNTKKKRKNQQSRQNQYKPIVNSQNVEIVKKSEHLVNENFTKIFNVEFMKQYTSYSSFSDFLKGGGFNIHCEKDFIAVPENVMDLYVQKCTKFKSWIEMLNSATYCSMYVDLSKQNNLHKSQPQIIKNDNNVEPTLNNVDTVQLNNNEIEYLNEQEKIFFDAFFNFLKDDDIKHLHFNRMSDKTISVKYKYIKIGRIKLCGKKTKMQYFFEKIDNWVNDLNLQDYIFYLDYWVECINEHKILCAKSFKQSIGRELFNVKGYIAADIEEYQILGTLDNKTCDICGSMDGKVFKCSEAKPNINCPPFHDGCRCTTIAYFEPDEIDAMFAEPTRIARDPVTGKNYYVPASWTYTQWKESLK